jgi:hypothetical protein
MPTDRVLHPALAEFRISTDEDGLMFRRPDSQFVIFGPREACRTCRPALMAVMSQHASNCDIYVVVKEESH